jgi:hypothetical protein
VADWLVSSLLSKAPPPTATAKHQQQQQADGGKPTTAAPHPRDGARCWELLAYVLEAAAPQLHGVNASAGLASAAAAACAAASARSRRGPARGGAAAAGAAALAGALRRALGVLGRVCPLSFRPALEQQLALLEAALQARAPGPNMHGAVSPP